MFLEYYGYEESHGLMDGRLIICTISVGFALFALAWDYFFPFPESRSILIVCVISYPLTYNCGTKLMLSFSLYIIYICLAKTICNLMSDYVDISRCLAYSLHTCLLQKLPTRFYHFNLWNIDFTFTSMFYS